MRKGIKENQRLMIENESQHLSILKIEYEMLALINSEILMFLFIDFLDFKDVCFCILGTKKKKNQKDICGMKLCERPCVWHLRRNVILLQHMWQ